MGAASPQAALSDSKIAQIRLSLADAKVVEAPYRAAHLVMAASKSERSAVVRAAVEAVLSAHPTAVSATVRAVLTVAPDEVTAVMEGVMEKTPAAYKVALAAVNDMNPASLSSAVNLVSIRLPSEAATLASFTAEASQVSGTAPEFSGPSSVPRSAKNNLGNKNSTSTQLSKGTPPKANVCLLSR